jgi:hypothetical protein
VAVIDNASSDGTLRILSELQREFDHLFVIALEKNIGFGPANNVGFAALAARYYVLVNHDAWLVGDSVSPAITAMEKDSTVAICGLPLIFPDGSPQTYAYPFSSWPKWLIQLFGIRKIAKWLFLFPGATKIIQYLPYGKEFSRSQSRRQLDLDNVKPSDFGHTIQDVDWVCGAAMVIDNEFVRQSKGFDPAIFLYGEDEDLCIAAHRCAMRVVSIDTIPLVHAFGWGKNRFNRTIADLKYISLLYFIRKNIQAPLDRVLMIRLLPFHVYGFLRFFYAFNSKDNL